MVIEFEEVDDFYRYVADTEVSDTAIANDGFEVVMNGYYDTDELEQILSKMKELQGEVEE